MMDLGMSGYQMIGGVLTSYAAGAPVDEQTQTEETTNTVLLEYAVPVFMEIVAFGAFITEDFTAQATDAVVSLRKIDKFAGTETNLKSLTLGSSNTALTKGDGTKDNVTAIAADADLDNGHVVFADLSGVARKLVPGEVLLLEHTTASTGAGGAYVPFAIVKISGPDFTSSKVWNEKPSSMAVGD